MQRDRSWRTDRGAVVLAATCALLALAALGPSLIGLRVFAGTDLVQTFAPWRASASATAVPDNACTSDVVDGFLPAAAEFRREVLSGDVPLWNNLASGGAPLAAVPSNAVWSPLSLPYLVLPAWLAPAWVKLLELGVTIGGTFLFLRRLRLSRAPALLGGFIFATSGFMVAWTNWPQTRTAAFLPVLLWSLERLVQERRWRSVPAVALTVGAMLLGGFPAVTGLALYLAGVYVLMRVLPLERLRRGRSARPRGPSSVWPVVLAGAGVLLGILVAAFQVLPFFGQLSGLDLDLRAQSPEQHLPLLGLTTVALPNAFGTCPGRDYVGPVNQVEVMAYAGSAVLVLCVLALIRRTGSPVPYGVRGFFVAAAAVTVVLGWVGGPLLELVQNLPVFSNNPVGRIRVILGFCLAVLAAMGFEALLRAREFPRSRRAVLLEVGTWCLLAVGALVVVQRVRANLLPTGYLPESDRHTLFAAGAAAVVLAAVAFASGRHRAVALTVIPVVVLVQALQVVLPYWPQVPREDFYPRTETHAFLQEQLGSDRFQGTGLSMFPGTNVYYDLRSLGGHAFTAASWRALMEQADATAFRTPTFSTLQATPETAVSPALDRMSVRYLVVAPEQQAFGDVELAGRPVGRVVVPVGGSVDVPVPGGSLRGAGLELATAPAVDGELEVDVLDGERVLASSGRRLFPEQGAGALPVALAGEDLPETGLLLRIRNATSGPVSLVATEGGRPAVSLVRPAPDGLRLARASEEAAVWERTRSLPRLRWAGSAQVVPAERERLRMAGTTAARPGSVILAADPVRAEGGPAALDVREDSSDALAIELQARGAGYLVVADGLQTGWTATVDGEPVELLDADHALVAVPVPAGEHRVELTYEPPGLRAGALVSTVALVLVIALLLPWRRVRPPRRAPEDPFRSRPATMGS